MIEIRPFASIGTHNHGWLKAHHHFSFGQYHDPDRVHWGRLRVWNDDEIAAHQGFPMHPHSDMEIITYVRQGAISHRDSLGNFGRTGAGDVQVMSAGSGIAHSELNLEDETTTLFQIWILPETRGGEPSWGAKPFPKGDRAGRFVPLASGYGDSDALPIRTKARVLGLTLAAGASTDYALQPGELAYLVSATGTVKVNEHTAQARDGIAVRDEQKLTVEAVDDAEIVMVVTNDI